ncbi:hypothetical protein SDC9_175260 [bioreactor metagenome]|uniref:Uncharacterized protein n=1 Tax=bioreactor metagenome TaxID=1076179 RepID=A0A645GNS0_9ZZZZ
MRDVDHHDEQTAKDIGAGHQRNYFFRESGNAFHAAGENDADKGEEARSSPGHGNSEGFIERHHDGIGLNHDADNPQGQDGKHRKNSGQNLAL